MSPPQSCKTVTKFHSDPASGSDSENHLTLSRTWKDAFYIDRRTMRNRCNLCKAGKYSKGVRTGRKKKDKRRILGGFTSNNRKLQRSGKNSKKIFMNHNYRLYEKK